MEHENNIELKERILSYLQLPEKIESLELKKQLVPIQFYATHSMTGTTPIGILEAQEYAKGIRPEYGAILIIDSERIIQERINRASYKRALFNDLLPFLDPQRLLADQRLDYVTALEQQALEAINEVEYYLTEHQKASEKELIETRAEYKSLKEEGAKLLDKLQAWGL